MGVKVLYRNDLDMLCYDIVVGAYVDYGYRSEYMVVLQVSKGNDVTMHTDKQTAEDIVKCIFNSSLYDLTDYGKFHIVTDDDYNVLK